VEPSEERVLVHVHGFHSYPARMHPDTVRALVEGLSAEGDSVFDPFCGSGTVAVVARELGRVALGSDLNPLAVELARLKTNGTTLKFASALTDAATRVVEHAQDRQKAKLGPTAPYGREDRDLFEPHVLLGLDGLRDGIEQIEEDAIRHALLLVLSSMLTKFSNKPGDSATNERPRRLARSFAFRFFLMKATDLCDRMLAFSKLVPRGTPAGRFAVSDARELGFLRDRSVSLVVTSPPYPGVYDYYEHHASRLRWLRLDGAALQRGEIGPRRAGGSAGRPASDRWQRDFERCFMEIARVLGPKGRAVFLVADSVIDGEPRYADDWLPELARRARLRTLGRASQIRPHFHAPTARAFVSRPRREHLIVLGRK
jgi:SAM-dependent methyltransferase